MSLPSPTDGGTTYTFQLRGGIRYSNGEPLRPEDFRRALERDLILGGNDYYGGPFADVVGGAACAAHPSRCDLSRGVVIDDAADTVTFHLVAPNPEFLRPADPPRRLPGAGRNPTTTSANTRCPPPAPTSSSTCPYGIGHARAQPLFSGVVARGPPRRLPRPDRVSRPRQRRGGDHRGRTQHHRLHVRRGPPRPPGRSPNPVRQPAVHHSHHLNLRFSSTPGRPPSPTSGSAKPSTTRSTGPRSRRWSAETPSPPARSCRSASRATAPYCPYTIDPTPAGAWYGPDLARGRAPDRSVTHAGRPSRSGRSATPIPRPPPDPIWPRSWTDSATQPTSRNSRGRTQRADARRRFPHRPASLCPPSRTPCSTPPPPRSSKPTSPANPSCPTRPATPTCPSSATPARRPNPPRRRRREQQRPRHRGAVGPSRPDRNRPSTRRPANHQHRHPSGLRPRRQLPVQLRPRGAARPTLGAVDRPRTPDHKGLAVAVTGATSSIGELA